MKYVYPRFLLFTALVLSVNGVLAQESHTFVHEATVSNCFSNFTKTDNPNLNGVAGAYPIFTHNFNPGGGSGTYADYKMGIWYDGSTWNIFNEDESPFSTNRSYNVLAPGPDVISFRHVSDTNNTVLNRTTLDHPAINGDPNAIVLFSGTWTAIYNTEINGIYYDPSVQRWKIYNQGGPSQIMTVGVKFNVIVPQTSNKYATFVHKSDPGNTSTYITTLNHPGINNNPNAIVFVTSNYNPGGGSGVYNDHNIGVYYNGTKWCIYNEDKNALPNGAAFNVLAFELNTPTIINNPLTTTDVKVFPNPASVHDPITVTLDDQLQGEVRITLHAGNGTCVYDETILKTNGRKSHQLQIDGISRGLYLLQVEGSDMVGRQKLIIQ